MTGRGFVEEVVQSEIVWTLRDVQQASSQDTDEPGAGLVIVKHANCASRDDSDRVVVLLWSDKARAEGAAEGEFSEYEAEAISLFDLLHCLAHISKAGAFVGVDWTGDHLGLELDPKALFTEISNSLSPTKTKEYDDRFRKRFTEWTEREAMYEAIRATAPGCHPERNARGASRGVEGSGWG